MSDPNQNPSSPDQQFDTIERTIQRCGYQHWIHLGDYRDNGVSGRLLRKRAGFQQMLFDIKSGAISPDLILVDDIDRFGRVAEIKQIRRDLYNKHGVLVMDAKSHFEDPNTPQGRIYNSIEEIRAVEEGMTKAHRVMRGKRDAIAIGRWPCAKPPFGYKVKYHLEATNGHPHSYCTIVPDPETAWIVQLLFRKADESGWGQDRLSHFLNSHPDIPDHMKPFHGSTTGTWMDNEIYTGVMIWPRVTTDVINDCRVINNVPEEEQIRVDDYCPPIVDQEVYDRVSRLRKTRGQIRKAAMAGSVPQPDKQIKAPAPGMTLNYILTGLVRCGHCNRSMVPQTGGKYVTQHNETHKYTAYICPGKKTGICSNTKTIPEQWLRQVVIESIKNRLFPSG
jgi:DNA invertase Pin-like site-specific DNA recombinase